jgi:hypothetical protein
VDKAGCNRPPKACYPCCRYWTLHFIPGGKVAAAAAVGTNALCKEEESMDFMEKAARSEANIQVKLLKRESTRQSCRRSWLYKVTWFINY